MFSDLPHALTDLFSALPPQYVSILPGACARFLAPLPPGALTDVEYGYFQAAAPRSTPAQSTTAQNTLLAQSSRLNDDLRSRLLPALDNAGVPYDAHPRALANYITELHATLERMKARCAHVENQLALECGHGTPPPGWYTRAGVWERRDGRASISRIYSSTVTRIEGNTTVTGGFYWSCRVHGGNLITAKLGEAVGDTMLRCDSHLANVSP